MATLFDMIKLYNTIHYNQKRRCELCGKDFVYRTYNDCIINNGLCYECKWKLDIIDCNFPTLTYDMKLFTMERYTYEEGKVNFYNYIDFNKRYKKYSNFLIGM